MKTETKSRVTKQMIRASHERQFNGEDYQKVAVDIWQQWSNGTEDEYLELQTSPDPNCDCGFCKTAPWED